MNIRLLTEVGYNAEKDFTFLRTKTDDFSEQLIFPAPNNSQEDLSIRSLLEDQEAVDFEAIHRSPVFTVPEEGETSFFGITGTGEEKGDPIEHPHMVLFGKNGSGALNFVRSRMLSATANHMSIVIVGAPNYLYGVSQYALQNSYVLDDERPLREQLDDLIYAKDLCDIFLIVGSEYEAKTLQDRAVILEAQQGELLGVESTLIHREQLLNNDDECFTGSDGEGVTFAVIGDVNEVTAKKVGDDVPVRNRRGVMWFAHEGEETTRVKTFLVKRENTI